MMTSYLSMSIRMLLSNNIIRFATPLEILCDPQVENPCTRSIVYLMKELLMESLFTLLNFSQNTKVSYVARNNNNVGIASLKYSHRQRNLFHR